MKQRSTKIKCLCSISNEVKIGNPDLFDWKTVRFVCEGCESILVMKYKKNKAAQGNIQVQLRIEKESEKLKQIRKEDEEARGEVAK